MSSTLKLPILLTALVLASCGGGADSPATTTTSPATTTTAITSSGSGNTTAPPASPSTSEVTERISVRISQTGQVMVYALHHLAESEGLFDLVGLDVETIEIPSSGVEALISGSVDFVNTVTSAPFSAHAQGQDVIAVALLTNGYTTNIAVSNEVVERTGITKDSPLEERVAALKGLKIAVTGLSSGSGLFLQLALEAGGVDSSTVEPVPLGGASAMLSAFETGDVDGISSSSPATERIEAAGQGLTIISGAAGDLLGYENFPYISLITTRKFAEENPEAVIRMVQAYILAAEIVASDRATVRQMVRDVMFPDLDEDIFESAFDLNYGNIPTPDDQGFSQDDFEQSLYVANIGRVLSDLPPIDDIQMSDVMTNEFIEEALARISS